MDYKKEIGQYEEKIKTNQKQLEEYYARMGQVVSRIGLPEGTEPGERIIESLDAIKELSSIIPEKDRQIADISIEEEALNEVREKMKTGNEEIKKQETGLDQYYKALGEESFNFYLSTPETFAAYKSFFKELESLNQRMEKAGDNLSNYSARSHAGNVFTQFFNAARTIYTERQQDFLVSRRDNLFIQLGRQLPGSELIKGNEDLARMAEPLAENLEEIKRLRVAREELVHKEADITKRLESLGVKGSSRNRLRALEKEKKQVEEDIREKQCLLGQEYANAGMISGDPEEEEIYQRVKALQVESGGYEKEIKKLKAMIRLEGLKEKINKNARSIKALEEKIIKCNEEIHSFSEDNLGLELEIKKITEEYALEG